MTKYLLATRHCEAAPAAQDLARVLTESGEMAARALGRLPVFQEFAGARLFGSAAIRTRQTLAEAFSMSVDDVAVVDRLYPDPGSWPGSVIEEIYATVGHAPLHAYVEAKGGKAAVQSYGRTAADAVVNELDWFECDRAVFAWHGALIQATICTLCERAGLLIPYVVMYKPLEPGDGFVLEFDDKFMLTSVKPYFQ